MKEYERISIIIIALLNRIHISISLKNIFEEIKIISIFPLISISID